MGKTSKIVFRIIWILLTIAAFVCPLLETNSCCCCFYSSTETMLNAMTLLSFPANLLFLFIVDELPRSVLWSFQPLIYCSLWFMLFITGYLQWCWAVPRIFAERKIITLNLAQSKMKENELKIKKSHQPVIALPQLEERRVIRIFRVSQFDSEGRTPLERVLGERSIERF